MGNVSRKTFGGKRVLCLSLLAMLLVFFGMAGSSYAINLGSELTQCANDSDNNGVINACTWTNGALTQNNATYAESDGVPQRWLLEHEVPLSGTEDHTAVFQYNFTKNDVYAYDFLVNVDHTVPSALINPCSNLPSFADPDDCLNAYSTAINVPIPNDPFDAVSLREHPPFPLRTIRFGCVEEGSTTFVCSNVSVDAPVHIPNTDCFQDCGTSDVQITVNFTTPTGAGNKHLIGLWVAAHLASATDPDGGGTQIGWGPGFGASSAPGSSFHFKLVSLDGASVGGHDDQLNANAIVPHNADLAVDKTCPATVVKGNNVSYTISVTNNGPESATNVFIDDTLPLGVTFVSATPSQGTCDAPPNPNDTIVPANQNLHCDLGLLQPLASTVVTVIVNVPSDFVGSAITDTVTVGGTVTDSVSANNTDSCTTTLQTATAPVDISVSKSDSPDPVVAGAATNLTYTLIVRNLTTTASPTGDATNVILTDSLPAGVTFVSSVPGSPTCDETAPGSGIVVCNLGTIDNCDDPPTCDDDQVTVTITVAVDSTVRGTITDVVTVAGDQTDPTPANNTDSEDTEVIGQVDLSVDKTCPATADRGTEITYDITVTNDASAPSTAINPHIEDVLPAGVTFVSATTDPPGTGCTFDLVDTVHCVLGSLAPGASTQAHITVLISSGLAGGTVLSNEAHIHVHNDEDTAAGNDEDTCDTTVTVPTAPTVDLEVTKADSPDPVTAGNNLTYTLTVKNLTQTASPTGDATGVVLTDTLPSGVTFVSASAGCVFDGVNIVTCTIGTIDNCDDPPACDDDQVIITIVVTVDPAERGPIITNIVSVSGNEPETNTANNSDTEDTTINAASDLSIIKTDSPDPVLDGNNLTYTLTVTNNGPSTATNVVVVDTLPASGIVLPPVSVTPSQGTCDPPAGNVITCNLGTIEPGNSATIVIVVTVDVNLEIGQTTTLLNTAVVSATEEPAPTCPSNNCASQETTVLANVPIPTLSEWGMIIFMLFAGLGSVYYLRRRKKV